jgi:alpha-L-arabinofuranosidase
MRIPRIAALLTLCAGLATAQVTLRVDTERPGPAINPAMWGVFFEDINFAADGGLWAELVKNRSFEFPDHLQGWYEIRAKGARGTLSVQDEAPATRRNPHYLSLRGGGGYGAGNEGFRGMGVKAGEDLVLSLRARRGKEGPSALVATLRGAENRVLAQARVPALGATWARLECVLSPAATAPDARLELTLEGPGRADLDAVSLMPKAALERHGFRPDLLGLLKELRPGFVRFPGGCVVEGRDLANRYDWKRTVAPRDEREPKPNRWRDNMAFEGRFAPDYQQSYQLGFFEFFQLCEDLGAEPLPVLGCGMACQFETGEMCPPDALEPYIQDALDLIEFATGPATSTWGKARAALGHPAPFQLHMLAIGNEQWGPEYMDRFVRFQVAIKARHPGILLSGSSGPWSGGEDFNELWAAMRKDGADLVDEHYYAPPSWFLANAHRYDAYPRQGPKVFAGEYAAHPDKPAQGGPRPNTWEAAMAEAAFMTGLERNADVVRLASYAPLLAHADAWQWSPDLIWFDSLRAAPTPSYEVQKLFSRNRGTRVLPTTLALEPSATAACALYASAVLDEGTGQVILKVVNASRRPAKVRMALPGPQEGTLTVLAAEPAAVNALGAPPLVVPKESSWRAEGPSPTLEVPPSSFTVLRLARPRP